MRKRNGLHAVALVRPTPSSHGLSRYAVTLQEGLRAAGTDAVLVDSTGTSVQQAACTAWKARGSRVVHLQVAPRLWGDGRRQVLAALVVLLVLARRSVVITVHDLHTPLPVMSGWRLWAGARRHPYLLMLSLLARRAAVTLVCTSEEAHILKAVKPRRIDVVPHYVDDIDPAPSRASRDDGATLVVLGFIHRRKGQIWAVRALPHLPGLRLVLAGTAVERNEDYLRSIHSEAVALGVEDRLRVTGWLEEEDIAEELSRASVGVAPYERIAASGSLATLVAAGIPIVARTNAYVEDLAARCPNAVSTYDHDDPSLIAAAVRQLLSGSKDAQRRELAAWAASRSVAETSRRHIALYAAVLGTQHARAALLGTGVR